MLLEKANSNKDFNAQIFGGHTPHNLANTAYTIIKLVGQHFDLLYFLCF